MALLAVSSAIALDFMDKQAGSCWHSVQRPLSFWLQLCMWNSLLHLGGFFSLFLFTSFPIFPNFPVLYLSYFAIEGNVQLKCGEGGW